MNELKTLVEEAYAFAQAHPTSPLNATQKQAVEEAFGLLNRGKLRVCEPDSRGEWVVNVWAKQAILLYFKISSMSELSSQGLSWVDKIPVKQWKLDMGVRVVPPAVVRMGAFVEEKAILMPCYINVGAWVGSGTMVDTWATVGSCAQIGRNVHLSGGVGIGGVLEPAQASPVIIEDDCFVGSRAIVVEGVVVKRGAVLGAGVVLTASTPIIDTQGPTPIVTKGLIPENAVVIPGTRPKKFPAGEFHTPCALIIGSRTPSTDKKTSLNQALRDFEISV